MKSIIVVIFTIFYYASANISLHGSKVYNIITKTKEDRIIVSNLETAIPYLDVWQRAYFEGGTTRILVPEVAVNTVESILNLNSVHYDVFTDDVIRLLENEKIENEKARLQIGNERISFASYYRHNEINAYLDSLASLYPKMVTVTTANKTPEGRELKFIKISTTRWNDVKKPIVVVDAGIHAREWISPSLALYMIHKLVENVTERDVVDKIDWLIFPVLNPDGYEYSHDTNRMWRKTRSVIPNSDCVGVDGNRNFDFKWMVSGASNDPCSYEYAGPTAFSEIETRSLRDAILNNKGRVKLALSIHSYGNSLLYPYSYDGSLPDNHEELQTLGEEVSRAIQQLQDSDGVKYKVGNNLLGNHSGSTKDYATGVAGVPLSYTVELPGDKYGFEIPPQRIKQIVTETWAGMVTFARHVIKNYAL